MHGTNVINQDLIKETEVSNSHKRNTGNLGFLAKKKQEIEGTRSAF